MNKENNGSTPSFTSKIGLVMAAVGSAVGLGNIWKFPYVTGENGGGAFLLVYLACVFLFGLPLLMTEFIVGKHSRKSVYGAFQSIRKNRRWQWLSWSCLIATVLVMSFYFMVTGWCLSYLVDAIAGTISSTEDLSAHFANLSINTSRVLFFCSITVFITALVLWFDVNKGIERLSKILMPLLLVMMFIMAVKVLMLPNSNIGMRFFFETDFSKITPQVILSAMGQCFFSLSIGFGALVTYGAYMPERQNILATSAQVVVLDTLVAVLAGVIVFPAVFAFGLDPAEGPQLVFVVLPSVFEQMSMSRFSSVLFFSLLCIAAITSIISLMEIVIAFISDLGARIKHPINRHKAVVITIAICLISSTLCVMSVCGTPDWLKIAGHDLFECFDAVTSYFLLPLNAFGMALFIGWFVPKQVIEKELHVRPRSLNSTAVSTFRLVIRYLVPIAIAAIFLKEFV